MSCKEKILSEDYLDLIEESLIRDDENVRYNNYCEQKLTNNVSLFYVSREEIRDQFPTAEMYSRLPKCYGLTGGGLETSQPATQFNPLPLSNSGIFVVQNPPLRLTGTGTIYAIIDTGIDYQSPLFRNPDGTTRILAIWDQTNQNGSPPSHFFYGTEYNDLQINDSFLYDNPLDYVNTIDKIGHGTKLAAVAVGNGLKDNIMFTSPAPDANLVVVKLKQAKNYFRDLYLIPQQVPCYEESDIMTVLLYVRSFVRTGIRPVVVFMGLGSSFGNHEGTASLGNFIAEISAIRNFAMVCGAGNEGNTGHHYEGTNLIGNGDAQNVEINVSEGNDGFFMEFWAQAPAVYDLVIRSPAGESTGIINDRNGRNAIYSFVYGESQLMVNYVLLDEYSGWQSAYLRFYRPIEGLWNISVIPTDTSVITRFHLWLPIQNFLNSQVSFVRPSPYVTLTPPSAIRGLITVSGYDSYSGSFYIASSRGYTTEGRVKPDFAAPAVEVSTPGGSENGTELSGTIVAGAIAQMLQWAVTDGNDPMIDSNEIKNYIIRGCNRDPGITYPNREFGYGTFDLARVFQRIAGISIM